MSRLYWPLSELIDRFTITLLKDERILDHNSKEDLKVLSASIHTYLSDELLFTKYCKWVTDLKEINGKIWDAEAEIRAGLEEKITAEDGWALCIRVRDLNRVRNSIKNEIVKETGEGFKEVRVNCIANPIEN